MVHHPDLDPIDSPSQQDLPTLAFGWLDPAHDHRRGSVPAAVIEALELAAAAPVDRMRGLHFCPWCPREGYQAMTYTTRSGDVLHLGGASVRVRGQGRDWLGPDLVLHYVDRHDYRPPDQFIDDVLGARSSGEHHPGRTP